MSGQEYSIVFKNLATKEYVDQQLVNVVTSGQISLSGYATQNYVTNEISNNIAGLVDETFVESAVSSATNIIVNNGTIRRSLTNKLGDYLTTADVSATGLARAAYNNRALIRVKKGETVSFTIDPSTDDFRDCVNWASQSGHLIEDDANFRIVIVSGIHTIADYIEVNRGNTVEIRGAGLSFSPISSITTATTSGMQALTVRFENPIPDWVLVGSVVGLQNCWGSGGLDSINGAIIVSAINIDRLSISSKIQTYGVSATTATVDTALTTKFGFTPNRAIFYRTTIKADGNGWDGGAVEGFINATEGGTVNLEDIAIAYVPPVGQDPNTDERDILFAGRGPSHIGCLDYVSICGAGDKVLRFANGATGYINRSCFGGGELGKEGIQILNSNITLVRCSFGSYSVADISVGAGGILFATGCNITGAPRGIQITGHTANVAYYTGGISFCNTGVVAAAGSIEFNDNSEIVKCIDPLDLPAANGGAKIFGDMQLSENFNTPLSANTWIYGSAWYRDPSPIEN